MLLQQVPELLQHTTIYDEVLLPVYRRDLFFCVFKAPIRLSATRLRTANSSMTHS